MIFKVFSPKIREEWLVRQLKIPSGYWNDPLLKQLFVDDDVKVISYIPCASNNHDDTLCWHYSANEEYLVSSGYKLGVFMEVENSCSRVKGIRLDTNNLELICVVWWHIWFLRNRMVHSSEKFVVEDIVIWCVEFLDEYKAANVIIEERGGLLIHNQLKWKPSDKWIYKLNSDAALDGYLGSNT
ncbi:hypothetical protein Q3G72_004481 [Acer saccharum]|nr:hypothetical protein Q3G72_004481 [Acer saccharum]